MKIFLSHSSKDEKWINRIVSSVETLGINVYTAERDPQPGKILANKIESEIEICDAFVVFLTRDASFSPYVNQEIGIAKGKKKLIIPLVESGIAEKSLSMLEGIEYIPFDREKSEAVIITTLSNSLKRIEKQIEQNNVEFLLLVLFIILLFILFLKQ